MKNCIAKRFSAAVVFSILMLTAFCLMAENYTPAPMKPNPRTDWSDIGTQAGMALFPSKPVAGQPGVIPGKKGFSNAWAHPEYQNYPGSVEHYRRDLQKYLDAINPFNHRTLLKNFIAVDMTGATKDMKEMFAEPVQYCVRGSQPRYSGAKRPAVSVVRLKPGKNRLSFKVGPLPTGMYTVRLIGLVESKNVKFQPLDLIIDMKVNDGPKGEVSHYVLRQNGTDNFYSNGEFSFHVSDKRIFNISVGLHKDSEIDFLVHNVDIHDLFGECAKVGGKTKSIAYPPAVLKQKWARPKSVEYRAKAEKYINKRFEKLRQKHPDKTLEEVKAMWRKDRDNILWNSLPPINSMHYNNGSAGVTSATDEATKKKLMAMKRYPDSSPHVFGYSGYKKHNFWRLDIPPLNRGFSWEHPWRLIWEQKGKPTQYYTLEDLKNNKPLPGLDFAVNSWGKRFTLKNGQSSYFYPITLGVSTAFTRMLQYFQGYLDTQDMYFRRDYIENGIQESGRDAAILLCRLAYDLPAYSSIHAMNTIVASNKQHFGRMVAHQQRKVRHYQMLEWAKLCRAYDTLFPMIKDNQELATAVGRFIPWVKTPQDVITMLDTHLIQFGARQAMYFNYFYDHAHAALVAQMAAIQVDPKISNVWVDAIFKRTWEYPHGYGSLRDFIYLTTQRDGTSDIGSFLYAQGGSTVSKAAPWLEIYVDNGGKAKYRLSNAKLYPRVAEFQNWLLESRVAGFQELAIGDVSGPTRPYGYGFVPGIQRWAGKAWKSTKDPRFAYCLLNYSKRKNETDKEWQEIKTAAKGMRNPLMANRSRILTDWGGILEGGTQSDDFRFRQAVRIRIGYGMGHSHQDMFDLGLWSLGVILAPDMGARGGYGRPGVKSTVMHNTATTGGEKGDYDFSGYAWIPELADMENVQYLRALSTYGAHHERQVAIIELDKGVAATKPPSNPDLRPGTKYDPNIVFPRAYVVDFFRLGGGAIHKYNFHGPTEDKFTTNLKRGPLSADEAAWAKQISYIVKGEQWASDINNDVFTATWRMGRSSIKFNAAERGNHVTVAPEQNILGAAYNEKSPRKYIRLHMPGQKGRRVVSGVAVSAPYYKGRTDGDWLRNVHVVHQLKDGETSLYAAVLESFAGKPFIKSVSLEGNVNDRRSMAALHVETLDGIRDINFADMQNAPERTLKDGTKVQGSFAYVSRDAKGLRQTSLVNGTKLKIPELTIEPEQNA